MNSSPTGATHEGVRSYFRDALSRSLELAHMLPSDPTVDLGAERASLEDMLETKRQQLAAQSFPPSVHSEAVALLRSIHPGGQQFGPEALQQACNAILRARIETTASSPRSSTGATARPVPWTRCSTDHGAGAAARSRRRRRI